MEPLLRLEDVSKSFSLHLQGGTTLGVVAGVSFEVGAGECVALGGPSGVGKSSLLKLIFGNYRCDAGRILIREEAGVTDIASAEPRRILAVRRTTIGYVSQFLRVIPRVGALDVVTAAGRESGLPLETARERARDLLALLNLPERLWTLPPATFSGGEQQRVNIARGLIADRPILLLDEPTASLDARNREVVVSLVERKRREGTAIVGIFHDEDVREAVSSRVIDVTHFAATAA